MDCRLLRAQADWSLRGDSTVLLLCEWARLSEDMLAMSLLASSDSVD